MERCRQSLDRNPSYYTNLKINGHTEQWLNKIVMKLKNLVLNSLRDTRIDQKMRRSDGSNFQPPE